MTVNVEMNTKILAKLISGQVAAAEIIDDQWPSIINTAFFHGLAPFLRVCLGSHTAGMTPVDAKRLRMALLRETANAILVADAVKHWGNRFHEYGIDAIWLKGAALANTIYPLPGCRPMVDVDVLVRRSKLSHAVKLMESETGQKAAQLSVSKDVILQAGWNGKVKFEIHHSLLDIPESRISPDQEWVWHHTQRFSIADEELTTLSPEAHVMYLSAHAILQHGESDFRLIRYLDLHRLITETPELDWSIILQESVNLGWISALERALSITIEYFATIIPPSVLEQLKERRLEATESYAVLNRTIPRTRWEATMDRFSNMSLLDQARMALSLLFPTPNYMRWRYRIDQDWKLLIYYPYRLIDVVIEFGRTTLSVRHRKGFVLGKGDSDEEL